MFNLKAENLMGHIATPIAIEKPESNVHIFRQLKSF